VKDLISPNSINLESVLFPPWITLEYPVLSPDVATMLC